MTKFLPRFSRQTVLHSAAITAVVGGLFWYWFVVADRYYIFLYNHLGATPFDNRTRSRYWMAGLVAAGMVLVGYVVCNWFVGRLAGVWHRTYIPPDWRGVWLLSTIGLGIIIPAITTTQNQPVLPFSLALACLFSTLAGLAIALPAGRVAAQQPSRLVWLSMAGWGLSPVLLLLRAVELPGIGMQPVLRAWSIAVGGTLVGAGWLAAVAWIARTRCRFTTLSVLVAGLAWSFLLLPPAHYLLFTPPAYRYISVAANFFALHPAVQALSGLLAWLLAWGAVTLQEHLQPQ